MKKKLEAELISIAHRILKLRNRAELDQLQQETLRLYEKISVLRFVEDNFSEIKPTIGFASAEEKLEEIYGIEDVAPVHANDVEAQADKAKAEKDAKAQEPVQDKENESGEGVEAAEEEKVAVEGTKTDAESGADNGSEAYQASEEEKEYTEEETDEEVTPEEKTDTPKEEESSEEAAIAGDSGAETDTQNQDKVSESGEGVDTTESDESPASEEEVEFTQTQTDEPAAPKEDITPEPLFDRKQEDPKKQKEITFEDYHDYKEPEFVKKSDIVEPSNINKEFLPKEPEIIQKQEEKAETMWDAPNTEDKPVERDWRDWEPTKSPEAEKPKQEESKKEESKREEFKPAAKTLNDSLGKTITLALNDRIAFEKNLFAGSGEDLNRVLSQLNTFDSFDDAKNFIEDLVKPDYNNWQGKEEYEERFIAIVEKKFD